MPIARWSCNKIKIVINERLTFYIKLDFFFLSSFSFSFSFFSSFPSFFLSFLFLSFLLLFQSISQIAIRCPSITENCLYGLMALISSKIPKVVSQTVVSIRQLLQQKQVCLLFLPFSISVSSPPPTHTHTLFIYLFYESAVFVFFVFIY